MQRFLKGFLFGIVIGAVCAWLYQRYLWPKTETVPARPAPAETGPSPAAPTRAAPTRAAPAMSKKQPEGGAPPAEVAPDDFVPLRGIGPAFARRLHEAGIHTYADLSRLTPEEVAERCQVPVWRILRDDWIGQAAARALS